MEFLMFAHVLRRRRIAVAVGIALAVLVGGAIAGVLPPGGGPAAAPTGQALAEVVVDTHTSLIATTTPSAQATIAQRAVLLAALMQSDAMTAKIAQTAGIPAASLRVIGPVFPPVSEFTIVPEGEFPQLAASAALTAVQTPYVVKLLPNVSLPIMDIGTTAPSRRAAVSLAQATIATLQSAAVPTNVVRAGAAKPKPTLIVQSLAAIRSAAVLGTGGGQLPLGIAAAIGLLAAWCAGIVVVAGLARQWRRLDQPAASPAS
jgi:hypothetical protein